MSNPRLSDRAAKDDAYRQRNALVAWLASLYPTVLARTDIEGWSDDWHWCVFISTPAGQVSFHVHDSHLAYFGHVKRIDNNPWDGHDDATKWDRISETIRDRLWVLAENPEARS